MSKAALDVRFLKTTSIADYFVVSGPTEAGLLVRQSNTYGVLVCLKCVLTRCPHVSAVANALLSGAVVVPRDDAMPPDFQLEAQSA